MCPSTSDKAESGESVADAPAPEGAGVPEGAGGFDAAEAAAAEAEGLVARVRAVLDARGLAGPETPVVLMVSGGSDSTALAYVAADLRAVGRLGPLAVLHVNHHLRGRDADDDALFVEQLAALLEIPLIRRDVDAAAEAARTGGNVEAASRRLRYEAAAQALDGLCRRQGLPPARGRIFTAHTADDRVENFYMRSIVGTGPGGFRAMRYENGAVARPLLDLERGELRRLIELRRAQGRPVARDDAGNLWREDATNAHTDRFRAYVRHELVPIARARNPRLAQTLGRTMNLIADEDDMLESMVDGLEARHVAWRPAPDAAAAPAACVLAPELGREPMPLRRRLAARVLRGLLGPDARIEAASVAAVLAAWREDGAVNSGYVANIQGNLAVSANKRGVRVEPMAAFRARRGRG